MVDVIVAGTFDLLHRGHKELLRWAVDLKGHDTLRVVVNGDDFVKERKNVQQNEEGRKYSVRAYLNKLGCHAEEVFVASTLDQWRIFVFEDFSPAYLLHGGDWDKKKLSELYQVSEEEWERWGIRLLYKDRYPGVSSTELREE